MCNSILFITLISTAEQVLKLPTTFVSIVMAWCFLAPSSASPLLLWLALNILHCLEEKKKMLQSQKHKGLWGVFKWPDYKWSLSIVQLCHLCCCTIRGMTIFMLRWGWSGGNTVGVHQGDGVRRFSSTPSYIFRITLKFYLNDSVAIVSE